MSGDRSRLLKVGEHVYREGEKRMEARSTKTIGAVKIAWDNGLTTSLCHNDMSRVALAPVKS